MSSTLIYSNGDYYNYHSREKEEQGLAIGGYESVFLADLVASYLFEKPNPTSTRKPTTESMDMTTWWCLKEIIVQEKLKTG